MITMKYLFVAILVAVFNIVVVNSNGRVCGTGAGTTTENSPVTVNCGAEVIDSIDFASYGRPTGTCGSYAIGTCHKSNSVTTVSTACLGKTTCTVSVTNAAFGGDPCVEVVKYLLIQARCRAPTSQPTGQPSQQPSRQPTSQPTRQPSRQPTLQPSNQPSRQPSRQPSNQPSSQPSNQPTTRPTTQPSNQPTTRPTTQPSSQPSNQPTSQPSQHPTMQPSQQPTTFPTSQPSLHPSSQPSQQPASLPTSQPSVHPSKQPSQTPTSQPSSQPHSYPSTQPSRQPLSQPSTAPSRQPSSTPSCQPTAQPSKQPSSQPAGQPTQQPQSKPSSFPSKQPSSHPSLHPSTQPSSAPSYQPFSHPSSKPSYQPSSQPSLQPFARPTGMPKRTPTSQPSSVPSTKPTGQPVAPPSTQPTSHPSLSPTSQPVSWPSSLPTSQPSIHPSAQPSSEPSFSPSSQPSNSPSCQPTLLPSVQPSAQPRSEPTSTPSDQPTAEPSSQPSKQPLGAPTSQPTNTPSHQPSSSPSCRPSTQPVSSPTSTPTCQPSRQPSRSPTTQPSAQPTNQPSLNPTSRPTIQPSTQPTRNPSSSPSAQPLSVPSGQPSTQPLARPTLTPSSQPSSQPTTQPTGQPSLVPTTMPSVQPSSQPSTQPSSFPSTSPSSQPSRQPSAQPTQFPTSQPTLHPSSQPSRQPNVRPSSQPSITPSSQPSSAPSHTRRPTFDRTFGTLPRNTSLSVQYHPTAHSVSPSFKIVLPFLFGVAQTGDGFDDIVVGAAVNGSNYILFGSNATRHHLHTRLLSVTSPAVSYDYSGRSVSNAGDINGDGYDDLIIGVPFAARCYVLFGTSQGLVNMTEGFTVFGAQSTDLTGWSVSGAGDVNNDTFADIIIGAPLANHGRLASVGASYVLFGQGSRFVDVYLQDDLDEGRGFAVYGAEPTDCLGLSVSAAGDVNGDGYADVVMGVLRSGRYFSGGALVVFGGSDPPSAMTAFSGSVWSYAGYSVSGAGDINGDGFSDVLIGSVPRRIVYETAMSYLVYGAAQWDDAVSLGNLTSRGVVIAGGGVVVSGVGDINGDGFDDVMVGNNYGLVAGVGFSLDYSQFKLEVLPTASPTRLPTLQPSVKPSRKPTMNPGRSSPPSQKPTAPTQPPSMAPSGPTILPSARQSSPTSCPSSTPPSSRPSSRPSEASKSPTSLPNLVPTLQPSVQLTSVSPSAAPTEEPSIAPSRRPTFSPTIGRRFPTRQPSASPTTFTEHFENNVTTVVISVSANVSRSQQPHRVHYIVNASIGEVRIVGSSSQVRGDVFTILRHANVSLTISHFSSIDVIDLTAFADVNSLADLYASYVGNSVIFRLPHNQIVKLLNFTSQLIRSEMFIFGQNTDSPPEEDDFMGTQKASFVNVVSTASSVVFVVMCYVAWRVHSAVREHNKKEKYTPQSPLVVLETLRTDEEYWAQLDLSAHTTNHSDSNSSGDSGSDVRSLQTNDSEQRMIAALVVEERALRDRDRDRDRDRGQARERVNRERVVARMRSWEQTRAAHRAHSINLEVDVSAGRRDCQLREDDDSISEYECESDNEYRAHWSDPEAGDEVVYSEWALYPQCLDNDPEDDSVDSGNRIVGFCDSYNSLNSQNSLYSLDSYDSAMFTISSGRSDNSS